MNTKVKKIIALMLLAVMTLSMTACNVGGSQQIAVKGCFVLEPNEENFKEVFDEKEDLDSALEYFFVVYDVTPTKNTEIGFSNTVKLTLNSNNVYTDISRSSTGTYLTTFLKNCGYASKRFDEILYSDNSSRMISVFEVNKNDINENTTGEIEIKLSDDLKGTKKIAATDIKTIDYMDGVFAVEDDSATYMLKCCLRADINRSLIWLSETNKNLNSVDSYLNYCFADMDLVDHSDLYSACTGYYVAMISKEELADFGLDEKNMLIKEKFPTVYDKIIEYNKQREDRINQLFGHYIFDSYSAWSTRMRNYTSTDEEALNDMLDELEKY